MIRTKYTNASKTTGRVELWSKDGKRRLGKWGFRTKKGIERAKAKARKREAEIKRIEYLKKNK